VHAVATFSAIAGSCGLRTDSLEDSGPPQFQDPLTAYSDGKVATRIGNFLFDYLAPTRTNFDSFSVKSISRLIETTACQSWRVFETRVYARLHSFGARAWCCTSVKGAGSYLAGMAVAIPILNVDGPRHTNNFSKNI